MKIYEEFIPRIKELTDKIRNEKNPIWKKLFIIEKKTLMDAWLKNIPYDSQYKDDEYYVCVFDNEPSKVKGSELKEMTKNSFHVFFDEWNILNKLCGSEKGVMDLLND